MTETFTWPVTTDTDGEGTFVVTEAKFGDNYSQRMADGINNERQEWNVLYQGFAGEAGLVLAFVREHKGATSFYWTPPLGERGLYICKRYVPRKIGAELWTLTMEFVQVGVDDA